MSRSLLDARRLIMDTSQKSEPIDQRRRHFFGAAAMTVAAAQFGMIGAADAQTKLPAIKPGTNT